MLFKKDLKFKRIVMTSEILILQKKRLKNESLDYFYIIQN